MKDIILLISIVIVFIFFLVEHLSLAKKDGWDKLGIGGLIMSIIGIIIVIISIIFDN